MSDDFTYEERVEMIDAIRSSHTRGTHVLTLDFPSIERILSGHCDRTRGAAVIDALHLRRQRSWSEATFGPGSRLNGLLDHIRKELDEIAADPTDLSEWVDVIILALDGAWRAGHEPQAIIDAIKAKQAKNEAREWPDWRTMSPDQAIEHVR